MAKKQPAKRKAGRPKADVPLEVRVLVRMDKVTGEALEKYARNSGIGSESTAARVLLMEGLRRAGLLSSFVRAS